MPLELWEDPSYIDVVRLRLETRDDTGLVDPVYVVSVTVWSGSSKLYDLGERPWSDGNGPLFRESEGKFYFDLNPYRYGIRESGNYTLKWSYVCNTGSFKKSSNFFLKEAHGEQLPKEITESLGQGDKVRIRFTIQDSNSNLVDPIIIDRLVIYQTPTGSGVEDISTKAVFSLTNPEGGQYIWTEARFLSGERLDIIRESEGDFYFDWATANSMFAPGSLMAILYYRLNSSISLVRGSSWETTSQEMVFSPSLKTPIMTQEVFEAMYQRWIPTLMMKQPDVDGREAVSSRIIRAFGKASKEMFDWADSFERVYDPDALEPRCLPSLASNVAWNLKGTRPEGWRGQIKRAVNLFSEKGTLAGLKGFVDAAGGRLESVIQYWQVIPRKTWTDYFVVDEDLISTHDLTTSREAHLNSDESEPYKFLTLKLRKILGKSSTDVSIRVVRGSTTVTGRGTTFSTWGVESGDKIAVDVPGFSRQWSSVQSVTSETELTLTDRYTGESAAAANFVIGEALYQELDPETYLQIDVVGHRISRIHWDPSADIDIDLGDEIRLQYQTGDMTVNEETVEAEILLLPLGDDRDEREINYPPKNFNSRLLEDPDGIWYYQSPIKETVESERLDGPIGSSEAVFDNSPLSHADVIKKPASYSFLPVSKSFVSCYGTFVKDDVLYSFATSGSGGELDQRCWIDPSGSDVTAIRLTEDGVIFSHTGSIDRAWVTYMWLNGQFTPKDKTFLVQKRDRLCPLGILEVDRIAFGNERTIFPYSENVYNMDEYNGSLRPSFDPCSIDLNFKDHCDCSPTTLLDISIRTTDLSERTIKEFEELIDEAKPFHARVRSLSFVGQFTDSIIFQESIGVAIRYGTSDYISLIIADPLRKGSIAANRGEYVYLNSIATGTGTLVDPVINFYSEGADFVTAPANTNGILLVTTGDTGEYDFTAPTIHQVEITGLVSAPSPGSPQRFSLFNPMGTTEGEEGVYTSLVGGIIYGTSPYSGALLKSQITGSGSETYVTVEDVDMMEAFGLKIGDFIRREGYEEFYEIVRFEKDLNGKYSTMVIEEDVADISIISLWRRAIKDQIGWFQETYNILDSASLPTSIESDVSYLLSTGTATEQRDEKLVGPVEDGIRRSTLYSPVVLQDLFVSGPSGYTGSLIAPFSSYGTFEISSTTYTFVIKGTGGTVGGASADVSPGGSSVSAIVLSEKGLTFSFSSSAPEDITVWYRWREGAFHPVAELLSGPKVRLLGLNATESSVHTFELYEVIPTGVMYNPKRYSGSLPVPYSAYGSFEKSSTTYYFVVKAEGGEVGKMSGISPSGSGIDSIWLRGTTVDFDPSAGVTLNAVEFAPGVLRGDLPEELLTVKIVPDYPYFIKVEDQNLIDYSYRRIPSTSDVDKMELEFSEILSVSIEESGTTTSRTLFSG